MEGGVHKTMLGDMANGETPEWYLFFLSLACPHFPRVLGGGVRHESVYP